VIPLSIGLRIRNEKKTVFGDLRGRVLACGVWRMASGVWRLASGVWRLASGVWRLAWGVGRLSGSGHDLGERRRWG
jgi:hypothetical protein